MITFNFVHFDLGPRSSNPCDPSYDRLIVTDMTSRGKESFCVTSPVTSYVSESNHVTLQFVTTSSVDAAGFLIFYSGGGLPALVFGGGGGGGVGGDGVGGGGGGVLLA